MAKQDHHERAARASRSAEAKWAAAGEQEAAEAWAARARKHERAAEMAR